MMRDGMGQAAPGKPAPGQPDDHQAPRPARFGVSSLPDSDCCQPVGERAPRGGLYGVFRAGPFLAAVSIEMVREVVPRPAKFTAFPSRVPEVLGAMELRGTVIPVIDFAPLLGGPSDSRCTVVMVVRIGHRLCGLLIDHISGVEQLDDNQFTAADTVPCSRLRPTLVVAGFCAGNRSGIVVDCKALGQIEGMPLSLERDLQGIVKTVSGEPTLLFSSGAVHFGLPAHVIDASIPTTVFEPTGIEDPVWVGMLRYKGALIPVIDTLCLLGIGKADRPGEGACVIVRLSPRRLVALRIDRVNDMRRIDDTARLPLQEFQIGRAGLLRSLLESEVPCLLIDPEGLLADPLVRDIAAIGEDIEISGGAGARATSSSAFLVMAYGKGRFAAPMAQVDEIIPAVPCQIRLDRNAGGIAGIIAHRGRGVPLFNLSGRIGIAPDEQTGAFIVIAGQAGRQMGFPINGLCSVERVPLQRLSPDAQGASCGPLEETIQAADGQTSCVVDLVALAGQVAAASHGPMQ